MRPSPSFLSAAKRSAHHGILAAAFLCTGAVPTAISPTACAQAPAVTAIAGTWQGTLHAGRDLRTVLKITRAPDGTLKSEFYSIDQGGQPIPVKTTTFTSGELKAYVEVIDGTFTGKLSADGNTIDGQWVQGDHPSPLTFTRATPATAWTIPEPPPRVAPMKADADPSFEVATIKPSKPDAQGKGIGGPPGRFMMKNTTLDDMLMFAYRLHTKQIVGGPEWLGTEKFDVEARPDTPGEANETQNRTMVRKMLVSRFNLKFHDEKRDLSAFVLSVARGGPKLEKSEDPPDQNSAFYFRGLGDLIFRNMNMTTFSSWLQTVLDRPVVDHTGLDSRYSGKLKWNPDESQFAIFGAPPHPSTAPDAPPPLGEAIQQQLGLKLEVDKVPVSVMVIDHVDKPSEN